MNTEILSIIHSDDKWDLSEQFIYNWRIIRVWFFSWKLWSQFTSHLIQSQASWTNSKRLNKSAFSRLTNKHSHAHTFIHAYMNKHVQLYVFHWHHRTTAQFASLLEQLNLRKDPKQHLKRCSVLSTYQEITSQSSSSSLTDLGWRRMTLLNGIAIFNLRGLWDRVGVIPTERFTL